MHDRRTKEDAREDAREDAGDIEVSNYQYYLENLVGLEIQISTIIISTF